MWWCLTCRKDVLKSRLSCKECGENQEDNPRPDPEPVVSPQSHYGYAAPSSPPYASAYSAPQPASAPTSPLRASDNGDLLHWEEEEPEPEPEMQAVLSKAQKKNAERQRLSEQSRPAGYILRHNPGSSNDQGHDSPVLPMQPPDVDMRKTMVEEMNLVPWGVEKALYYTQNKSIEEAYDYYENASAGDPEFLQTRLDPSLYAVAHTQASVPVPSSSAVSISISQPPKISLEVREFLETYKVSKCKNKGQHNAKECPDWHHFPKTGAIDRRRNPFKEPHYFPDMCPQGNIENSFGERCLSLLDCGQ